MSRTRNWFRVIRRRIDFIMRHLELEAVSWIKEMELEEDLERTAIDLEKDVERGGI